MGLLYLPHDGPHSSFLLTLASILTRLFVQSSPELVLKAVDPNSATDFYGLFDAYGGTNQVEEQKVSMSLTLVLVNWNLTNRFRLGR